MKNVLFTFFLSTIMILSYADNDGKVAVSSDSPAPMIELNGNVVDIKSGEALVGVEIKIEGTELKTYTDLDGNFKFKDIKPGKYNLIASYISYKGSLIENFSADQDNNELSIKLEEAN